MNEDVLVALARADQAMKEWLETPVGNRKQSIAALAKLDASRAALHSEVRIAVARQQR